jgi:hypothetical protein
MNILYILCLFGTFFPFWYHVPGKIWQSWNMHVMDYDNELNVKKFSMAALLTNPCELIFGECPLGHFHDGTDQGCQIFLGATHQKRRNILHN